MNESNNIPVLVTSEILNYTKFVNRLIMQEEEGGTSDEEEELHVDMLASIEAIEGEVFQASPVSQWPLQQHIYQPQPQQQVQQQHQPTPVPPLQLQPTPIPSQEHRPNTHSTTA